MKPKTNRSGHKGSVFTGVKSGGLVPETVKRKREPERLRHRDKPVEAQTIALHSTEPEVDLDGFAAPVRAVLNAGWSTCRFPTGQDRADFAFCGKPATVVAAGRFTYCGDCARRMRPGYTGSEIGRYSRAPLPSAAWTQPRPKP